MGTAEPPQRLVVIGSSSGGIDALRTIAAGLPENFPAAVVVAQHLDPRRPSHLEEILANRTSLRVATVLDTTALAAGVIHVVPANHDVVITDHSVSVQPGSEKRPKPSVDTLLASAATVFAEQLIAVILTGEGSDGAEGARQVKDRGGTVVIQDPRTAAHPSMPLSLAPTSVDVIAPLDSIAELLVELVREPAAVLDDEQLLERFLARVRDRTGIDFATYKRPTIARRLHRRMAAVGARTFQQYLDYVSANPDEYARLATTFLIKVTEFFRDPDLFAYLREQVIPQIVRESESREREIRVWSAGCATGEEAYSIAILFAEVLGDQLPQYNVRVFATDVDGDAVDFARRGTYGRSSVASLPAELLDRHFTRVPDGFEIRKQIRALTVFGQHDLGQRAPFPRIDLAVARNVLIYFTPELQKRALQLFAFSLREGGFLVLGKAESVTQLGDHFAVENPRLKVYRRHGERVLIPPARGRLPGDERDRRAWPTSSRGGFYGGVGARQAREQRPSMTERAEQILLRLPVGVVLVNDRYDIQLINATARRLLSIHGTAVGEDFVHVASVLPSPLLREGLDGALAGRASSVVHEGTTATGEDATTLRLTFEPHATDARQPEPRSQAVVLIEDLTEPSRRDREREARIAALESEVGQARRRADALATTNEELIGANQELTLANAELRSANDELLVGSEEVQAATEEVETLNEELQATNEELETLNEELQATIEELNTTNDDLQARTAELEETASNEEEQRRSNEDAGARLVSRLVDRDLGVLIIDAAGTPVIANDAFRELSDHRVLVPQDRTPPLQGEGDVAGRVLAGEQVRGAYHVTESGRRRRLTVEGDPLLDADGRVVGGIVVLRRAARRSSRG